MIYKLLVSYDAGCNYSCLAESQDMNCLIDKAEDMGLDEQMLRWIIENENGDISAASLIHKRILCFMDAVEEKYLGTDKSE